MPIKFSSQYVVDSCVLLAYMDTGELYHQKALSFFKKIEEFCKEGRQTEILIPAHLYLEVNLNIDRKRREAAEGKLDSYNFRQPQEGVIQKPYPVNAELMKKIQEANLYEKFAGKLKVGDFIYAAISYLESATLVSLDGDFLRVMSDIDLIQL